METRTGELTLVINPDRPLHNLQLRMLRPKRTVPRFAWPLPPRNSSLLAPRPRPPSLPGLGHHKPTQPQPDPDGRHTPKRFAQARAQ